MQRSPIRKPKALYTLDLPNLNLIYGPEEQAEISRLADIYGPVQTAVSLKADPSILEEAEVLFSGWGAPVMDEAFLDAAKNLKVVFYGSGSIRRIVTPEFWERDISITNAVEANAIPVAEYCMAAILLSMKHFWSLSRQTRLNAGWLSESQFHKVPGNYHSLVGFISLGSVVRRTLQLLEPFQIRRLVYSQELSETEATRYGVELAGLDEIFRTCDVVSLHSPGLPETQGMIRGRHFELLKPGSTFINTARGIVVNEPEMCEVLARRPEITAILDVADPEPPLPDSLVTQLPNVILTPHIAGSAGPECQRLGQSMVEEFKRYLAGKPLRYAICREVFDSVA